MMANRYATYIWQVEIRRLGEIEFDSVLGSLHKVNAPFVDAETDLLIDGQIIHTQIVGVEAAGPASYRVKMVEL